MEKKLNIVSPHQEWLKFLFANKSKVYSVFNDVLGLYEINHIAITHVNLNNELLTLSSTPAIEFNLFNSNLWRFDRTYQHSWFDLCKQSAWESLYQPVRYDELYYIKQIKHHYPVGYSLAAKIEKKSFIFSLASKKSCAATKNYFEHQYEELYKIAQYCTGILYPLFTQNEPMYSQTVARAR